ncbi:MAG: hypothetical protein AAF596_10960, partial [Planctomycetota bacterium]
PLRRLFFDRLLTRIDALQIGHSTRRPRFLLEVEKASPQLGHRTLIGTPPVLVDQVGSIS